MAVRTLVVHVGGIGDFLLASPAIASLAVRGPVEVAGRLDRAQLAVAGGVACAAHDLDTIGFSSLFATATERFREFIRAFDRVVVWMRDDGAIEHGIRALGIRDVHVYPGLSPNDWPRHASEYYLNCVGADAAPPRSPLLPILPSARHDVILHCGSGGRRKNWPLDNFQALTETLQSAGRTVSWCVGPAEEEWLAPPLGLQSLRLNSLVDLASHLAGANLYIGNDSGVTHLAAAVGCTCIAVFGPTNPAVWGPKGVHVHTLCGSPWPESRDVIAAAKKILENRARPAG